ncbi:hypothetical protein BCV69DRAFT_285475 [Microstroma glucosiphilum]|uniref:CP-type G domain-containing protein n=1 Tax=Pseudomicrostroma glucosiphilum TaxID=1684307 RepID=A0A316TZU4_9BASI|nr:hypothetical protein BCV69DRAFT_285475 [Pseudomicrostroma glucosiphilum]PWN18174.1 hypothetical protein BCV69DRAFT_285475 [Pseudomicrostroma glucosiphilum]
MGRKTQLPPSRGIKKKQDTGPAAFFKHRKQAQQQQAAAGVSPTSQASSSNGAASPSAKGKAKETNGGSAHNDILLSMTSSSADMLDDDGADASTSSLPFSPYSHLTHSNIHGTNKDSSLRAYAHHLRSLVTQSDVLIQVLDARDPMGSRSSHTENLLASHPDKKLLLILTKIDLVPKEVLQKWLVYLRQSYPTLAFKSTSTLSSSGRASRKIQTTAASSSSLEASSSATLLQLLKNYARSQPKGMSLTVGIYGPPNVGKSSLINSLVKSRACSVAPRPGETKNLQTVLLDRKVRLIDSPGVAMSSGRGAVDGIEDVLRGTVKIELVEDPAKPVAEILKRADPVKVTKLYKLPPLYGEEEEEEEPQPVAAPPVAAGPSAIPQDNSPAKAGTHEPVDFASMRRSGMDEDEQEDDSDGEEDDDDFHRPTFDEEDEETIEAHGGANGSTAPTAAKASKRPPPIGYDAEDVTDFLLRLAFTKGKMMRGGKPDIDGAARMVINDWNLGRIAWYKSPPASVNISSSTVPKAATAHEGGEGDEQMESASAAPVEHNEVMTSFSEAFDLEGLFAQADAQLFGGGKVPAAPAAPVAAKTASPATGPRRSAAHDKVLSAADVTSSSLGKRARGDEAEDDSDDDDAASDAGDLSSADEDDSDGEAGGRNRRLSGFASTFDKASTAGDADGDVDEAMSTSFRPVNGQGHSKSKSKNDRDDDALSSLAASSGKSKTKSKSKIPAHLLQQQQQQQAAASMSDSSSPTQPGKRGHRSAVKKARPHKSDPPAYLERLEHKASLPTNAKKLRREGLLEDMESAGGKKGGERKRLKKMQKRESGKGAGGVGGVWKEMEEVTLD